jgi:hypothetical protein
VIHSTNATRQDDKATRDRVPDPYTKPSLPPRKPSDDHGGRNHPVLLVSKGCPLYHLTLKNLPGVDVKRVGTVPVVRIKSLGRRFHFIGLEIVVGEHQLGVRKAGL